MADQETLDAIESAELIIMVDAGRVAADPFKLTAAILTLITTRLADTKSKNTAATLADASTLGASGQQQAALDKLADLLRNGYNGIGAVASDDLPDAQRAQVYAAYGWDQGLIGDLKSPSRIETLANLAVSATADASVPTAGKYAATLVARIANWLAILDGVAVLATGGTRETLNAARNASRDLLLAAISRVRHFYCSASDDGEGTPELAKIGMQPKRAPGDAQPQPLPDAAGAATFNAAARTLTIPALPGHASYVRAYRQPAGGAVQSAGVSNTPTVSLVGTGPLVPGVSYTAWVVGVNSRGEGPESSHVTFTA